MERSNEIDYNSKISNFLAMTETGDPEIAQQYLKQANWDETIAVNNFFNKINSNINKNNSKIVNSINNSVTNNDQGFFSCYILEPIKNIFSSCINPRDVDIDEEEQLFRYLPNKVDDFEKFSKLIQRRIGIIILYNRNDIQFLHSFISKICRNSSLINLLEQYCIIYPLLSSMDKAFQIQNMLSDKNINNPSFIFCYNNNRNNISLNKSNVLAILENESTITLENFNNKLIESLEKINKNITNKVKADNNYNSLTDAEILEKQKNDMEALEQQAQREEQQLIKEEKILKEIENKAKIAKNKIEEEPEENNPDCTIIIFRYPDGEKRIERRFLKSHTIQNLYDFVTSLGKEIYTEEENNTFSLYQPFPPKKYDNMKNTLEEEGLFPNAIIQIKEE